MKQGNPIIWLIRHGETEWSLSGAHTGRTDIPLTAKGEASAIQLGQALEAQHFGLVLTSPLLRARETCRLAGFGEVAVIEPNIAEWNYGDYEGRTTSEIRADRPGWTPWADGFPGGETIEEVAARARAVIHYVAQSETDIALFAHGHILRILAACWIEHPPQTARALALGTGSISRLGYERQTRVIQEWNRHP